jgi:hypothetical protein
MEPSWQGEMMRATGTSRETFRAYAHSGDVCTPIIRHQSSIINGRAFTLIELLVVISTVALLMAILMPCLQRVRKQAKAVGCQANLRQWGMLYAPYCAENDGYLPDWGPDERSEYNPADPWWAYGRWIGGGGRPLASGVEPGTPDSASFTAVKGILLCPMAAQAGYSILGRYDRRGGTFLAWTASDYDSTAWPTWNTSYAPNHQAHSWPGNLPNPIDYWRLMWMTNAVRNASAVPVFMDTMSCAATLYDDKSPPPGCDAVPTRRLSAASDNVCINRHSAGINSLFLDWSVRRVGLKEIWTLKWHREYSTVGPWTKRGGVRPEDWPQWLRRFKDY